MNKKAKLLKSIAAILCVTLLSSCGNAVSGGNASAPASSASEETSEAPAETEAQTEEEPAPAPEAELSDDKPAESAEPLTDLKIVYFSTFEDEDISKFANRGENDTSVLSISTEFAKGGTKCLAASGRSETWNGPAFRLDEICEPDKEYLVSAAAMQRDHSPVTISFQYTDESGEVHYSNLASDSGGVKIRARKGATKRLL